MQLKHTLSHLLIKVAVLSKVLIQVKGQMLIQTKGWPIINLQLRLSRVGPQRIAGS